MIDALRFFEEEDLGKSARDRRVLVNLDADLLALSKKIAKLRNDKQRWFGGCNYSRNEAESLLSHEKGAAGELAVALLGHGEFDTEIFDYHGDDGIDTVLEGFGVTGVKTTAYDNPCELRVEVEHFRSDIDCYVCCYYNPKVPHEVWICGWATPAEVAKAPKRRARKDGPLNFTLAEWKLHSWNEDA